MHALKSLYGVTLLIGTGLVLSMPPAAAQETPSEAERNPSRIVLSREHPEAYTGGQTLEVRVRIDATDWAGVTAMGLYEKIPEGWTLQGIQAAAGPAPGVQPEAGSDGLLQFIWITPPRTPIELRYTLRIPARESGPRGFSGQVEYRLGGGRLTSNVALTQLDGEPDELPVITLRGSAAMAVPRHGDFQDPGATASDKEDGDLSNQIQVAGQVDTARPGSYRLVYGVLDSAGNRAVPVTRVVTVEADTDDPGESPGAVRTPRSGGADPVGPAVTPRPQPGTPAPAEDGLSALLAEFLASLGPSRGPEHPPDSFPRETESPAETAAREAGHPNPLEAPVAASHAESTGPDGPAGSLPDGVPPPEPAAVDSGGRALLVAGGLGVVALVLAGWWMAWRKGPRRRFR